MRRPRVKLYIADLFPDGLHESLRRRRPFEVFVLRGDNDGLMYVHIQGFGKIGTIEDGPAPQFLCTNLVLKPYDVNLDKILAVGNYGGDVTADSSSGSRHDRPPAGKTPP